MHLVNSKTLRLHIEVFVCCRCGHDVCQPRPHLPEDGGSLCSDVPAPRVAPVVAVSRRAS